MRIFSKRMKSARNRQLHGASTRNNAVSQMIFKTLDPTIMPNMEREASINPKNDGFDVFNLS